MGARIPAESRKVRFLQWQSSCQRASHGPERSHGAGTDIKAILFAQDPQLAPLDTPNGRLAFVQVVGITLDELDGCRGWRTDGVLELLARRDPLLATDLSRRSILHDPAIAGTVREARTAGGLKHWSVYSTQLEWHTGGWITTRLKIVIGAKTVNAFKAVMPNRLLHDQDRGRRTETEHPIQAW